MTYRFWLGEVWLGIAWLFFLGLLVVGQRLELTKRAPRTTAYALNWLLPALVLALCVDRALAKDYWGVAFFSIGLGFAVVNSVFLFPSARRTQLFRILAALFFVVTAAAIWKTISP